ncbi:MAG: glycosyltransferase family 1 protein [Propionibacteriaceae bacterium]|jgi:hypothetical protein|nr:glycosyltransferase family 1 protein [Propionibacteriaceae bacterium]
MKVAIKFGSLDVTPDGEVAGFEAGDTLVRRLLRFFPTAQLIAAQPQSYPEVEVVSLETLDAANTVVVNMDVADSVEVWHHLRAQVEHPQIMNFIWWDSTRFDHPIETAELALSCALFPTFANSDRTARAVAASVRRWMVPQLAERARISGVNLGIRWERLQPRQEPEVPVVLYPAIYVSERKQPEIFVEIVTKVAKRTPILVEARLAEAHLVSDVAMKLSHERWAKVGPLASRDDYWVALAGTTAFVATAREESYGLEYLEAMCAGAIGIFPDREWVHALLPANYPFIYRNVTKAASLLHRAVTETAACRSELDAIADGDFLAWLRTHHSDDSFETAITEHITSWFGEIDA